MGPRALGAHAYLGRETRTRGTTVDNVSTHEGQERVGPCVGGVGAPYHKGQRSGPRTDDTYLAGEGGSLG